MKKITLIFSIVALCVLLCLGLVSCGGNGGTETGGIKDSVTDSTENSELTTDSDIEQGGGLVPDPEPETEKEYVTITFDTQGGSAIESIQAEKGGKISKPSDPEKLGYELEGWYVSGEKWSFVGYIATEDMTLTANWNIVEYTIEYVCEGIHSNKASYTVEDEFELSGVILDDYDFLGWYKDENYTKPITKFERGTTGNLKLYAKISPTPLIFSEIEGGYSVTDCDEDATIIVIPETYKGKLVTTIGDYAFWGCTSFKNIEISSSVTTIGDYAFWGCTSLESIEIPNNVTSIGYWAFWGCTSLESIAVDKNNQNYCSIHGNLYSKDQKTLIQYAIGKPDSSFTIPSSVTAIGGSAFEGCTSLESVTIQNGVTTIGNYAFYSCTSLTIHCEVESQPSGWDSDWNYSYRPVVWNVKECGTTNDGIKWATTNDKPNEVVVCGVIGGTISITIPDKINNLPVTEVDESAFEGCTRLESIAVDKNNQNYCSIDGNLYSKDQKTLIQYAIGKPDSSFVVPDSVTTIGESAFEDCTSLESIVIPSSVTTIGYLAFYDCTSLTIYAQAENQPSGWDSDWNYSDCPVVWNYKEN